MTEERLKLAQELAQIGSWELDIINNELWWSDEVYRLFGMQPQEFEATYESFLDHIHPDDREMVNKAYSQSLKDKKPYEITHRLKLKDGSIKYVTEKCKTFYDKKGNPIKSIGTVQDITKLQLAEEKFKRLFENLGDAVYVTKIGEPNKGLIMEVNSAAILQTGYTREELLNMNIIKDLHISGTGDITTEEWEEKLKMGEAVTSIEMKRRKDGTKFWTEIIVTTIDYNGGKASLSINHDITDQKNIELELKKHQENLEQLVIERTVEIENAKLLLERERDRVQKYLDIAGVIILVLDTRQNIELINQEGCNVLAYTEDELIGKNWYDTLMTGNEREEARELFIQELSGEIPFNYKNENYITTKSGEQLLIAWRDTPIYDENKNIIGTLSSGEDITKKRKAEQELKKRADELETINKIMIDREMKIIEMKEEVNMLSEGLGKKPPYPPIWKV